NNLEYWPETIQTLSLVLISVVIAMIIGIPVGIWMSQNKTVQSIITPILDFMQTMPAFVYLIPSVVFFGIGMIPGIIATIIFLMSIIKTVQSIIPPILDFMQTMPAFVYLIPSVVFFGIGMTPGIIATIIFSMPPTVRMTNLGIRQVDAELIEASNAFGSTTGQ